MLILCGLIVFVIATSSLAHDTAFQQTDFTLKVPIFGSKHVYDKQPLIKFEALDGTSTKKFSMDPSVDFLHIDEKTGELWFKEQNFYAKDVASVLNLKIILSTSNDDDDEEDLIETTANINFVPYKFARDFCETSMCFYNSIEFHAVEDFNDNFKMREIGEIAPRFHRRICRKYHVEYQLLNGTNFFDIKNNKIFTKTTLDRERNPSLKVNIQCHIRMGSFVLSDTKVFNVTVIDVNDNPVKVQENHKITNMKLDSPNYTKNNNVSTKILFLDNDTLHANIDDIEFQILNDKEGIFKHICTSFNSVSNDITSVAYSCDLQYTKTGHFTSFPYCIVLQAKEVIKKKVRYENATICFERLFETLPKAEQLTSDDKSRKARGKVENSASGKMAKLLANIEYPKEVIVLQNASRMAQVTEPKNKITDSKVEFSIDDTHLKAFDILETGGIIYVADSSILQSTLDATYDIHVTADFTELKMSQNFTIKVKIIKASRDCKESNNEHDEFLCSHFEVQTDCELSCGIGSKNGRCKWRPYTPQENDTRTHSSSYHTCVPDLETCGNGVCDAFERYAEDNNDFVCSQDCVKTKDVHGTIPNNNPNKTRGIGKVVIGNVCGCNSGSCYCGDKGHKPPLIITTAPTTTSEIPDDILSIVSAETTSFKRHPECGTICLFIMIGSPSLLVIMIIILVSMRRRYVNKIKKRMLTHGPSVHYRGSNDTEIININIINEVQKENYLQTYHKFDFDAKWEFDRDKLTLDTTLGEGEFGKVLKAYIQEIDKDNSIRTVAVKTIKTKSNSVELLALLSEFQLLQELSHPNVIKLVGACIKSEPPLLIIEYCCFGSLRSYLRLSRKLEEAGELNIDGVEPVTATDVLSFSWQICKGMSYLADIKLVHRDLAARNVLLAEGRVCKISDFGLTRDVYEDDAYLKKSKDRVPVKWMSPESLADHVYTAKTDVWSFGVVGWEIITLGATPYPGIPPQNLYHLLRSGYRMERPENCSPEIYMLLEACWADDPMKRPSFKALATKFESLLGKCAKYLDVDIVDGAISNPLYLSNVDDIEVQSNKTEETDLDYKRIELLWTAPKFKADINNVDNKKYLLKYDDQLQLLLARYDKPKPVNDANNFSHKLRYQNDFHTFMKPNRYINSSQPDLLSLSDTDRERLLESRYDTPSIRRMKSYIEMRNIARARRSSISTTADSFDDNNNEMPCKRTTINENLNFNDLDKLLKSDKEISFKFSSVNNLNDKLTETKC
ncbi:uncharacterized protein Ret isoform X3 [Chironomus tepperi]|uniref:uncharacterized protein Ret isoform X3 n=1 Tax=Chironomus tepperi TaxID=113505 RepID=UPI00391FBA84